MKIAGKKIVVTGANGFIGSHLVEMLVEQGASVRALVRYNSLNSWGWLEDSSFLENIEIFSGDIRDSIFCKKLLRGAEIAFHLAALIAIPYSYIAPQSYVETNICGTLNICQAALEENVQRIIITSTSEVYGTAQYVPIDEKHPLQPQSPYSASKIGADSLALSYFNSFQLPVIIARPFNTYGPRQSARAVIPTIITQILSGCKKIKLGDIDVTRDLNYVLDTCRGLLMVAECNNSGGEVINIGSNYEITVREIFQHVRNIVSSDAEIEIDDVRLRPEKSEVRRLWCDNKKISQMTGFIPEIGIEEGLKRTVEWFVKPENLIRYKYKIYNV